MGAIAELLDVHGHPNTPDVDHPWMRKAFVAGPSLRVWFERDINTGSSWFVRCYLEVRTFMRVVCTLGLVNHIRSKKRIDLYCITTVYEHTKYFVTKKTSGWIWEIYSEW